MKKWKSALTLGVVAAAWLALSIAGFCKPAQEFSLSERRRLAQFPKLNTQSVMDGKFMTDFESYTLDQFPLREDFRRLKAFAAYSLYAQKDNNEIYLVDGYASKLEYPLKENSVLDAVEKFRDLYEKNIAGKANNVYYSVIPDKNEFLAEENGYPAMDYARLYELMAQNMDFAEEINLRDTLELGDYYQTDTHWRQEKLIDTARMLAQALGVEAEISWNFEEKKLETPFYGVYYGQASLPLPSERICYLTNAALETCTVYNLETDSTGGVYDFAKLDGSDPYEFFLSGAAAVLYVENPGAQSQRELVVFRDSFASSLMPLLCEGYSKITLVDTRYIASALVGDYVEFEGADVLFLYSSLILNNSSALK